MLLAAFLIVIAMFCVTTVSAGGANAETTLSFRKIDVESFAQNLVSTSSATQAVFFAPDDDVDVIIEVKGDSLYDKAKKAGMTLRDYTFSPDGEAYYEELIARQSEVLEEIKASGTEIEYKYGFTSVINAIGASVRYSDMETLGSVGNIVNVSLSTLYDLPDADSETYGLTTAYSASEEYDYDGTGSVVAIIDTGIDYNHKAFSVDAPENRITKELFDSVKDKLLAMGSFTAKMAAGEDSREYLTEGFEYEDTYISGKIPFGFDYGNVDTDPYYRTLVDRYESYFGVEEIYAESSHGTHVAGIAAGNNGKDFFGVARNAEIVVMKVVKGYKAASSAATTISTIDILAAVNDSVLLGVDSINISLGSVSAGFAEEYDLNDFYQAAVDEGIMVAVAAGNDYYSGRYSLLGNSLSTVEDVDYGAISSPATYEQTLCVASSNTYESENYYFMLNGEKIYFSNAVKDSNAQYSYNFYEEYEKTMAEFGFESSGSRRFVVLSGTGEDSDYDNLDLSKIPEAFDEWDLNGCIVVVQRGGISFADKVSNAQKHGAGGIVIYDNTVNPGLNMVIGNARIPVCYVSLENGLKLVQSENTTIDFDSSYVCKQREVSAFSIWGPLSTLELKPEITAPGGFVLSAVGSTTQTDLYEEWSGTSMASPYITGALALVKQYVSEIFPDYTPEEVVNTVYKIIMSNAETLYDNETPFSPRQQGAGGIALSETLKATAYIEVPDQERTKIELSDDPDMIGVYEMPFTVVNFGKADLSYEIDVRTMTSTIYEGYHMPRAYDLTDDCSFVVTGENYSDGVLTVPAGERVSVTLTLTLGEKAREYLSEYADIIGGNYVDGFIILSSETETMSVPYLGYFGDWTVSPKFDYTSYGDDADKVSTWYGILWGYWSGNELPVGMVNFNQTDSQAEGIKIDPDKCAIAPLGSGYSYFSISASA